MSPEEEEATAELAEVINNGKSDTGELTSNMCIHQGCNSPAIYGVACWRHWGNTDHAAAIRANSDRGRELAARVTAETERGDQIVVCGSVDGCTTVPKETLEGQMESVQVLLKISADDNIPPSLPNEAKVCSHEGCLNQDVNKGGSCWIHAGNRKEELADRMFGDIGLGGPIVTKRVRPLCSADGCANQARRSGGVCDRHGAKPKCSNEGCSNLAKKAKLPTEPLSLATKTHLADKFDEIVTASSRTSVNIPPTANTIRPRSPSPCETPPPLDVDQICSEDGCLGIIEKGGLCKRHVLEYGVDILKKCSREGCTHVAVKGSLCMSHGLMVACKVAANTRNGHQLCSVDKICIIEGCTNQVRFGGVCGTHGAKVRLKAEIAALEGQIGREGQQSRIQQNLGNAEERLQSAIRELEAAKNGVMKGGEPNQPPRCNAQDRLESFASRIGENEGQMVNAKEDLAREAMIKELEDELSRRHAREALENEVSRRIAAEEQRIATGAFVQQSLISEALVRRKQLEDEISRRIAAEEWRIATGAIVQQSLIDDVSKRYAEEVSLRSVLINGIPQSGVLPAVDGLLSNIVGGPLGPPHASAIPPLVQGVPDEGPRHQPDMVNNDEAPLGLESNLDSLCSHKECYNKAQMRGFCLRHVTKRSRKRKKDPNAPKGPHSSFILYSNATRDEIKAANPDVKKSSEIAQILGRQFNALSEEERSYWNSKVVEDRERYCREMAAYKGGEENEPRRRKKQEENEARRRKKQEEKARKERSIELVRAAKDKMAQEVIARLEAPDSVRKHPSWNCLGGVMVNYAPPLGLESNVDSQSYESDKRKCSHDGCTNQAAVKDGVCYEHGAMKIKRCSREGCTNHAHTNHARLCYEHGFSAKPTCSREGCTNQAQYCRKGSVCIRHCRGERLTLSS